MIRILVRKVGNSLGVILPAEATKSLGVSEGDSLYLTESPDGLRVTPFNPEFAAEMTAGLDIMKRYRNALRELSKK